MSNNDAIKILTKWQHDGQHRTSGVFVKTFNLQPQSKGFYLEIEFYLPGDIISKNFFADTIPETIQQALDFIVQKKFELREELDVD